MEVIDRRSKDSIKSIIKANLSESGDVKPGKLQAAGPVSEAVVSSDASLTFEQTRELLLLQAEVELKWLEVKRLKVEECRLSHGGAD